MTIKSLNNQLTTTGRAVSIFRQLFHTLSTIEYLDKIECIEQPTYETRVPSIIPHLYPRSKSLLHPSLLVPHRTSIVASVARCDYIEDLNNTTKPVPCRQRP